MTIEQFWARLDRRSVTDGENGPRFEGYAAVFGQQARIGAFDEVIAPTAFNNTLQRSDIFMLWQHDAKMPLARSGAGNLQLSIDDTGLKVAADFIDTQYARDAAEAIRVGVVDKMSFGFSISKGGEKREVQDDGRTLRTVTDARLYEVSPVCMPAYSGTAAVMRQAEAFSALCERLKLDPDQVLEGSISVGMIEALAAALRSTPGAETTLESEDRAETTGSEDGAPNRQLLRMQLELDQLAVELGLPRWNPNGALPGASADRSARVGVGEDDRGHHPR
jgi:HK97 family phage prohead protease